MSDRRRRSPINRQCACACITGGDAKGNRATDLHDGRSAFALQLECQDRDGVGLGRRGWRGRNRGAREVTRALGEPTRRLRAAVSSNDAADDEDDEYIATPLLKQPKRSSGLERTTSARACVSRSRRIHTAVQDTFGFAICVPVDNDISLVNSHFT